MSLLFHSIDIGPVAVKNRFARSATGESRADRDGVLRGEVYPIYDELARGGVGLIISGHMYAHPDWPCGPRQTGIWDERHLPGLTRMATAAKAQGTRAVAQINYGTRRPADMADVELGEAADAFVAAARRACEAGFDGVQIHAAHGYLLSCMLTPSENTRTDSYGGDAGGRRRLLLEIAVRTRAAIGPEKMLLCKLGCVDGRDNSLDIAESVETARQLQTAGVDGIEVSSTLTGEHAHPAAPGIDSVSKEAYFRSQALALSRVLDIPVILVGGLRSLAVMEELVDSGVCHMVSLCRPLIREPDLINRFAAGETQRAACISCNKCYNPRGFRCVFRD